MGFKNHAEIFKALLDGKTIFKGDDKIIILNGNLHIAAGHDKWAMFIDEPLPDFNSLGWEILKEPRSVFINFNGKNSYTYRSENDALEDSSNMDEIAFEFVEVLKAEVKKEEFGPPPDFLKDDEIPF